MFVVRQAFVPIAERTHQNFVLEEYQAGWIRDAGERLRERMEDLASLRSNGAIIKGFDTAEVAKPEEDIACQLSRALLHSRTHIH